MEITKRWKVRLYPTKLQEEQLAQIFGACRWIYNHYLEQRKTHYLEQKKTLSYAAMSRDLTVLRKKTEWLSNLQLSPLGQSLRNLDKAYNSFFRKQNRRLNFFRSNHSRKAPALGNSSWTNLCQNLSFVIFSFILVIFGWY